MSNKEDINVPIDWGCYMLGQYFKIGRFNKVFVWRNDAWVFTRGVTEKQINNKISANKYDKEHRTIRRKYVFKNQQLNENF